MFLKAKSAGLEPESEPDGELVFALEQPATLYCFLKREISGPEDDRLTRIREKSEEMSVGYVKLYTVAFGEEKSDLAEHGFYATTAQTVMALPLDEASERYAQREEVTVMVLTGPDDITPCAAVIEAGLNQKVSHFYRAFCSHLAAAGIATKHYLALLDGVPVAVASQSFLHGLSTIDWVTAVPRYQGQDLERYLIAVASADAARMGCATATALVPAGEGEVFASAGFQESAQMMIYDRYSWDAPLVPEAADARQKPAAVSYSGVLKRKEQYEACMAELAALGLPGHVDDAKNWDGLAALSTVLRYTDPGAAVLDAGGEYYSALLPQLASYGYADLWCVNLAFKEPVRKKNIAYLPGDITATSFEDAFFDAVTCLSVIEHGVKLEDYFREMHRILKPGGILFTSTDYWHHPLDTSGQKAYDVPIHIFSAADIEAAVAMAGRAGFALLDPIDYASEEKVVEWKDYHLSYTFLYFTLQKI